MQTPQPRTNPARTPHAGLTNPANEPRMLPPTGELGEHAGVRCAVGGSSKAFAGFTAPISALLSLRFPPTCDALTAAQDVCDRRVPTSDARCWQHR